MPRHVHATHEAVAQDQRCAQAELTAVSEVGVLGLLNDDSGVPAGRGPSGEGVQPAQAGLGKSKSVLVIAGPDKQKEAEEAGADVSVLRDAVLMIAQIRLADDAYASPVMSAVSEAALALLEEALPRFEGALSYHLARLVGTTEVPAALAPRDDGLAAHERTQRFGDHDLVVIRAAVKPLQERLGQRCEGVFVQLPGKFGAFEAQGHARHRRS